MGFDGQDIDQVHEIVFNLDNPNVSLAGNELVTFNDFLRENGTAILGINNKESEEWC